MVATNDGLWVGSDTDRIKHFEYHGRIAFFPLAGGTPVPQPDPAALPVDAYTVGGTSAGSTTRTAATSRARVPSAVRASLRSTPPTGCR